MKEAETNYFKKWNAFIGIALLSFGCYLDYTVVNIALPTIQQDLKTDLISLQWIMNIYFLALCVLATIMGRFGDMYGRLRCFYLGVSIFAIASVIAGLSHSIGGLIFGRLLQGIGAALIFPLGPSLLAQIFPEQERGKAIALFGSIGGIALALGPVLGGFIVTYLGWRWIFFINIPICLLGFLFTFYSIKKDNINLTIVALDIRGALLLGLTMAGIVLSLINSQNLGWSNPITLACLGIGTLSGIFLFKVERNQENPLVNFSDFSNLLFFAGGLLCFLAGVLSAVTLFFDPLYLQIIKNQSPELSGLILFAVPVAVFILAFFIGALVTRFGVMNTLLIGFTLACIAALLQLFFSTHTSIVYIVFAFICLGSMWAMGNTVAIIAAQTAAGPDRMSVATGTMVTMFNIGGSIGLAIAVAIYHWVTSSSLAIIANLEGSQRTQIEELISNPSQSLDTTMTSSILDVFTKLFLQGFTNVMWFLLVLSVCSLLIILKWQRKRNIQN